jgi:hypothetical protein
VLEERIVRADQPAPLRGIDGGDVVYDLDRDVDNSTSRPARGERNPAVREPPSSGGLLGREIFGARPWLSSEDRWWARSSVS